MSRCTKIAATFGAVSVLFRSAPSGRMRRRAQMEYERQQREYRSSRSGKTPGAARQQQIMQDNARRQQES